MNFFKSHFLHNKRQRNGIFFFIVIIIIIQGIYSIVDFSNHDTENRHDKEIAAFQKEYDSLKTVAVEKNKPSSFNPNYLTDFKGYQLGMSLDEINRLLEFRKKGEFINSAKEFQNITQVNDSLMLIISPLLKFPDWVNKRNSSASKKVKQTNKEVLDINLATKKDFETIYGIGDKLSSRIIKYRTKIQGFSFNDQLYEVWGLQKEVAEEVLSKFEVKEQPIIKKININTSSFKEVLALPYIDYELTKKIFEYRTEVAEIQTIEELKKIDGFPLDKFNRIALYLEAI
jgi:DNA uptake protein ComE-like DNA-binding protein